MLHKNGYRVMGLNRTDAPDVLHETCALRRCLSVLPATGSRACDHLERQLVRFHQIVLGYTEQMKLVGGYLSAR